MRNVLLHFFVVFFYLNSLCAFANDISISVYNNKPEENVKDYYLTYNNQNVYIGTFRQKPELYKFDSIYLLVGGNRSNELFLVSTLGGEINLQNIILYIYNIHPELNGIVFNLDKVEQESNGEIIVTLYSISQWHNDPIKNSNLTERMLRLGITPKQKITIKTINFTYHFE